jgi:predicted DNA-binding protein (MmcQ/YjbR family)
VNIESYRTFCLSKKGVTEEFPFGEEILVFKVMGKMFALTNVQGFASINLKCDPEEGAELREKYSSVLPGYHMNKKHWITVLMDGSVGDKQVKEWIMKSYELVSDSLPRAQKEALKKL